ncbi:hypothetical protein scyTo_0023531, partial [Scyliorhinus torazame]|nr:hypothetical protein [Scyliorhinus torazame]
FWVICADMAAQYNIPDPLIPGKMEMAYQGLARYLSSGALDSYALLDNLYPNYIQQHLKTNGGLTPQQFQAYILGLILDLAMLAIN